MRFAAVLSLMLAVAPALGFVAAPLNTVTSSRREVASALSMSKIKTDKRKAKYPNSGKATVVLTKALDGMHAGKGVAGDVLRVNRGFFLNYLLPNDLATVASQDIIDAFALKKAEEARLYEEAKEAALAVAEKLVSKEFELALKVGEDDAIFGTVTKKELTDLVCKQLPELDAETVTVTLPDEMKKLGAYAVFVKLHPEVNAETTLKIIAQ